MAIPNKNGSKVPRGKKRKQMYLDELVASGVDFNINMNHEEVMRTIIVPFRLFQNLAVVLLSII